MKRLVPTFIPDSTLEHIHQHHEQHITRQDLREVLNRPAHELEIGASSKQHVSDLEIRGKTLDGKSLHVCVIVDKEAIGEILDELRLNVPNGYYGSIIYNAWQVKD